MEFDDLFRRADLNNLEEFLIHGGEGFEEPSTKTYSQRLKEADSKVEAFFEARFSDIKEIDEIVGYYYKQAIVYRDVYFEMGLITGAKIAFQIHKRMEELS